MKFLCIQLLLVIVSSEVISENKRLLLHDPVSIAEAIFQLRTEIGDLNSTIADMKAKHAQEIGQLDAIYSQEVANLNATQSRDVAQLNATFAQLKGEHAKEVADLRAGLNAEKLQRCRTGSVDFGHELCATHNCTESRIIHFSPSFSKVPVIAIAFSRIDVNKNLNTRIYS
ncbi:uncharacterized protein LOC132728182 [Ruditapes philippinarum]|uniref:uncharacterized protein LOC132728182 n=1 Tax=Ruditapes philippinarum TaxID=129788 RepID=UPI00295C3170|nr:uncharacterized protein LOC132728182 [Ruditapes philippinarum]